MQLGEVLRKWRLMRELTVRQAAKMMGISYATLCRIENGRDMDGRTLAAILRWLTDGAAQSWEEKKHGSA